MLNEFISIIISLFIAIGYTLFLYYKRDIKSLFLQILLSFLRFSLVFIVIYLLLAPFISSTEKIIKKPILVFAIDNSQSMKLTKDSSGIYQKMKELSSLFEKTNKNTNTAIRYEFLNEKNIKNIAHTQFNHKTSNLDQFIHSIQEKYQEENLAGVFLFSDGIYNQGKSPLFTLYPFPIHVIAHGDTLPKKDLILKNVLHNKMVFKENITPLVVEIQAEGFSQESATIKILLDNNLIQSKTIFIPSSSDLQSIPFSIETKKKKGILHYQIVIESKLGEFTKKNNTKDIYVEVQDEKKKILILASAPHPDIKTLKSAISTNERYEIETCIISIHQQPKQSVYDLIILHQLPDEKNIFPTNLIEKTNALFYIIGPQTSIPSFHQQNDWIEIPTSILFEEASPSYNSNFNRFSIESNHQQTINSFPPLTVHLGDYSSSSFLSPILFQKIGNIITQHPLLSVGEKNDKKIGILMGEGIWKWHLQEYKLTQQTIVVDELLSKLIQYLTIKEKKKKFQVLPIQQEFTDQEAIRFETQIYNDLGEKIVGKEIELTISSSSKEKNKYTYINNENPFELSSIPSGIYYYKALLKENEKEEIKNGIFIVKETQLEILQTQADFNLLRTLAKNTGGHFFKETELEKIETYLQNQSIPSKIETKENKSEIIQVKWIFFLILVLACTEWIIRKLNGYI